MDLSDELARTLLALAPDATVVVNGDGIVVFANEQIKHTFGYSSAELVGQSIERLLPERFRDAHPHHRDRFASKPKLRPMGADLSLYGLHKSGREFPVEISLSPVTTPDGVLVVAAVRDATVHQDKEDRLVEANRAKSRFLAAASHDLRQPLQTLNLLNRAAWRHAAGHGALRGILGKQQRALDSMSALLASVLDISKLDSGAVVSTPVPSPLAEIFDRLRSDFEPQAADKGLELVIEDCVEAAHTDPELLRRLLGNLLSNAIRYTHRGSVRVSCIRAGNELHVEVRDTGIGIPNAERERIFEEFYQVDRGAQRPEGLGLGLSIVRRLATLLECKVDVTSAVDEGTAFRVTLRRVEPPAALAAVPRDTEAPQGGRILIIDDEPEVAEAIAMLLELEGFTIGVASCEREALERAREHVPDVLVSDYHLRGGETGAGVVAAVRAQMRATVPVVFLTGDTAKSALGGAQIESSRLLNKPVRADELLAAVRDHLASSRAA